MRPASRALDNGDLERLLAFRDGLRHFLHWSEEQARGVGITPAQHQLLLVIRGHGQPPSIGDVAEHLLSRHHSVVQLVDRAEKAGLVSRMVDGADHRIVRLHLTRAGEEKLLALSAAHLEELSRLRPSFESLWNHLPTSST